MLFSFVFLSLCTLATSVETVWNNDRQVVDIDCKLYKDLVNESALNFGELQKNNSLYPLALHSISLNECNVTSVRPNFLEDLVNLYAFQLTLNPYLDTLHSMTFRNNGNLKRLVLSDNVIKNIPEELFRCDACPMSNFDVEYLDLSENDIETLHPSTFSKLPSLETLLLNDNNIKMLQSSQFSGLGSLETLDIASNEISVLDPSTLMDLPSLRHLDVSSNSLVQIWSNMFSASMRQNLEYLDFSVNEIETIDEGAFVGMIQLEHLHLSNNKITDVSVLFVSFPKLISLDLSYNEITSIESMQNLNAPELMRLDFSNNALIEVVGSELVSLDNNTQLNFEANSITTVDLEGVWIKTMSFEKNQISVVKSLPGCDRYVVVCFVIEY